MFATARRARPRNRLPRDVRVGSSASKFRCALHLAALCGYSAHMRTRIERQVIAAARSGQELRGAAGTHLQPLRAELIRELVDGIHGPIHYRGIQLASFAVYGDVDLSHAEWRGNLQLTESVVHGDVLLNHASITGRLLFDGTVLGAFEARDARIDGVLYLRKGFRAEKGVRGLGLQVTGALSLTEATLVAPPELRGTSALGLYRASVGDLFLTGAVLEGGLYAIGMSVNRNVRLQGAKVRSRAALGLDSFDAGNGIALSSAVIGGSLYLWTQARGPLEVAGQVELAGARATSLVVTAAQLRSLPFDLNGFAYERVRPAEGEDVLAALDAASPVPPLQGYVQLAHYADRMGAAALKRDSFIHLERRMAQQRVEFWAERGHRQVRLGAVNADADGNASADITVSARTKVQARFAGLPRAYGSHSGWAHVVALPRLPVDVPLTAQSGRPMAVGGSAVGAPRGSAVVLQQWTKRGWALVGKAHVKSGGRFVFVLEAARGVRKYRVVVPATKMTGRVSSPSSPTTIS
jgi:hypothetical protein